MNAVGISTAPDLEAAALARGYFGIDVPFMFHIGLEPVSLAPGVARTRLPMRPHLANSRGHGHGGALMSALDFTLSAAARSSNPLGLGVVTIEMSTHFLASATTDRVRVASPQATQLAELMASRNLAARPVAPNVLETTATTAATIGELAAQGGIVLHELTTIRASLEEAYMTLTSDSVEYRTDPASQAQMQQAQVRQAVPQGSARG